MKWIVVLGVGVLACSESAGIAPLSVCPDDAGGRMGCVDAGSADIPAEDRPTPADNGPETPACVQTIITVASGRPVGNPPQSIYKCTYRGATAFYLPPQCCDSYSLLIGLDCTPICAPSGGINGGGDGQCPDFRQASCALLWQDDRTR
jgi:hypothetical protein